jgi:hypothetical protein
MDTPEELSDYERGVADERDRLLKVLLKFHQTFGTDEPIESSQVSMQIKYMYEFVIEKRAVA